MMLVTLLLSAFMLYMLFFSLVIILLLPFPLLVVMCSRCVVGVRCFVIDVASIVCIDQCVDRVDVFVVVATLPLLVVF